MLCSARALCPFSYAKHLRGKEWWFDGEKWEGRTHDGEKLRLGEGCERFDLRSGSFDQRE